MAELDNTAYRQAWADAQSYNAQLPQDSARFHPTEEDTARYQSLLNITGSGIMGYIEIPSIRVSLPIYHGVEDTVFCRLPSAILKAPHCRWAAPTATVRSSGHRGLPSAKLFTNLDQLAEGDVFLLRVLDEVLTYQVDQIHIVEPDDVSLLEIEQGKDLCTLVTCTPYGVNSHRLLVRGHRIENQARRILYPGYGGCHAD